jgi:hypothetical protein
MHVISPVGSPDQALHLTEAVGAWSNKSAVGLVHARHIQTIHVNLLMLLKPRPE